MTMQKIQEIEGCDPEQLPDQVLQSKAPLVLRGLVSDWPFVQAAKTSMASANRYLKAYDKGAVIFASIGDADSGGRVFYDEKMEGFNFKRQKLQLNALLDKINLCAVDDHPAVYYMDSTSVDYCLPGLRNDNDLALTHLNPLVSIWIGNQTRIAAHYDIPNNIACVAAGARRFTLFPPEQLENLYVGPLDFNPAGQAISLVDFKDQDFDKYPKFKEALKHAQCAELQAGDAIYIPSMWWHHVEGLEKLNVLINYWWQAAPAFMGSPMDVLNHALLSIRSLPEEQRKAWQHIFNFYVFNPDADAIDHIPKPRRGALSAIDEATARRLRSQLLKQLNH